MGRPIQAWYNTNCFYKFHSCSPPTGNETYRKAHQILENAAIMDKFPKNQIIETIEETYITELSNNYTGFMIFKKIDLVHDLM